MPPGSGGGTGGGNGGAPVATTTSSSTTCSPIPLPTELIVITVAGTSSTQFDKFLTRLKLLNAVLVTLEVNEEPTIDYRFFSCYLDLCQAKELLDDPMVEMIIPNSNNTRTWTS